MQAYEISKDVHEPSTYVGDLAAVRAVVRTLPREMRHEVRIFLKDFPHDKSAFVQLLNGRPVAGVTRRKWRPGQRGGALTELRLDDD